MSLFGALNVAMTSIATLNTSTRVVSDNIANAENKNYNSRQTQFDNLQYGGVEIANITRKVNTKIFQDLMNATSETNSNRVYDDIYQRIGQLIGTSNGKTPIVDYTEALETAWKAFEAAPVSDAAEKGVLQAANNLINEMERLSDGLEQIYSDMQNEVSNAVDELNVALAEIHNLNRKIVNTAELHKSVASLENLRDEQISIVATMMKVKQIHYNDGSVHIYTPTGVDLVASAPSAFAWNATDIALTKTGKGTTNLITTGRLTEGIIDSYARMLRTDSVATRDADGTMAPIQKMRNQLDEYAFILIDDSIARANGNLYLQTDFDLVDDAGLTPGNSFTISAGGVPPTTITIKAGDTVQDLLNDINAVRNVSARIDGHDNLQILTSAEGLHIEDTAGQPLVDLGFSVGTYKADNPPTINYAYNEVHTLGNVDLRDVTDLTALAGIAAGDSFNISAGGGATTTFNINAGDSITGLLAGLNNVEGIRAKLDSDGYLRISSTKGQLSIANGTNTPLGPTGLGIASSSGNIYVVNKAQKGELSLGFFEVKARTALHDASRVNISINSSLANGTRRLKDSSASGVVQAMAGNNRSLSGSGLFSDDKDYTSLMASVVVDVTIRSKHYGTLFKQEDAIRSNLYGRLRNEVGVDIDEEVALLTVLQKSYTASARVIDVVGRMFDSLSRVV